MAINLKPILDSTKIALQKEATDRFGTAVETFAKGVLGPALGQPAPLPGGQIPFNRNDGSFYASSYAAHLAGGTSYRPKLKFLFKVEFIFTEEAKRLLPAVFQTPTGGRPNDFTFMVKSVDRPKIDFEYEDDVNEYNFRTRVLKKIRHRELTVTFLDDTGNRVLNFFRGLMMLHSPITRRQLKREGKQAPPDKMGFETGNGMLFSNAPDMFAMDNAIRGVTNNDFGNVIDTIRVKQMYIDPGAQLGSSNREVIYDFLNARIVSFDLDELSHEGSDPSSMTMQFDYDWMEIVDVGKVDVVSGPTHSFTTPGIGGAPVDMSTYGGQSLSNPGGGNTFADILTNQAGRALSSVTSSVLAKAGLGRHGSTVVGGLIGAAARDIAGGIAKPLESAVNNSFGLFANDSANGGPSAVKGITSSATDSLSSFVKSRGWA